MNHFDRKVDDFISEHFTLFHLLYLQVGDCIGDPIQQQGNKQNIKYGKEFGNIDGLTVKIQKNHQCKMDDSQRSDRCHYVHNMFMDIFDIILIDFAIMQKTINKEVYNVFKQDNKNNHAEHQKKLG